jgi:hypothetical protein
MCFLVVFLQGTRNVTRKRKSHRNMNHYQSLTNYLKNLLKKCGEKNDFQAI